MNKDGHSLTGLEHRVPVLQLLSMGGTKLAFVMSLECHSEFLPARNFA